MRTHEQLAVENFELAIAQFGEGPEPTAEWRITFFFYAALHAVTHKLAQTTWTGDYNHKKRENDIKNDHTLRGRVERDYDALYRLSIQARYQPTTHPMPTDALTRAKLKAGEVLKRCSVAVPTGPVTRAGPPPPTPGGSGGG